MGPLSRAVDERERYDCGSRGGAGRETTERVSTVGVVGGGIMGSGIAEVSARAGCDVIIREVERGLRRGARWDGVRKSLARAEKTGKLTTADREAAEGRVLRSRPTSRDLADRDLVVEAVVEDEAEKIAIFHGARQGRPPDALLASNTSSIPIMKLAAVTPQPRARDRHALLQPGPGAAARRAGAEPADLARDRGAGRGVRRRAARQAHRAAARTAPASSSTPC